LLARLGVEDRSDQRGEHRLLLLARVPERLAEEMDGAALPRRAEHLADRVLQSFVRVGDDQLHAGQATLDQAAEEVAPERLRLRFAAVEAITSRRPDSCTPCAITKHFLTTRPPFRTFSTFASSQT
jgi:hypothetical protein